MHVMQKRRGFISRSGLDKEVHNGQDEKEATSTQLAKIPYLYKLLCAFNTPCKYKGVHSATPT